MPSQRNDLSAHCLRGGVVTLPDDAGGLGLGLVPDFVHPCGCGASDGGHCDCGCEFHGLRRKEEKKLQKGVRKERAEHVCCTGKSKKYNQAHAHSSGVAAQYAQGRSGATNAVNVGTKPITHL